MKRWPGRLALLVAALALAGGSGGCSMSYQLDSMFERQTKSAGPETTASINGANSASLPAAEADSALRAVATELLRRNEATTSLPWENPTTGARGTITPIAAAYTQAGRTCRDFLASYIRAGAESWLQGEACQSVKGHWEVRSLKPWTRS